jgi:hypothetical protein
MSDDAEQKMAQDEAEKAVEQWKVKKLIATLELARGYARTPHTDAETTAAHLHHADAPHVHGGDESAMLQLCISLAASAHHAALHAYPCALRSRCSNGTSMISLIIPPKDQVSRVAKMLGDEYGTASNIKSRVNRLSVLGAITSVQQRLKLFNRIPTNGLVVSATDDDSRRGRMVSGCSVRCDGAWSDAPYLQTAQHFLARACMLLCVACGGCADLLW